MNKIVTVFLIIVVTLNLSSCHKKEDAFTKETEEVQGKRSDTGGLKITEESIIEFDEETYDFKEIEKGAEVTHIFKFTNVGKRPLIISEVRPSCGCTTPKYTKDPVAPGKKGSITVTFDSSNFEGTVYKSVAVSGNFETKMIKFKAKIN
ncbi:MAG: DUF1573 domain-containing protein [Flavobacteriaceae bacterium]|jgi:hypothetical protein|nr:DUF1573 domain-containing protein [Flavobacteriaceae bacterium]